MSIVQKPKGLDEEIFMQQFPNHEHFLPDEEPEKDEPEEESK